GCAVMFQDRVQGVGGGQYPEHELLHGLEAAHARFELRDLPFEIRSGLVGTHARASYLHDTRLREHRPRRDASALEWRARVAALEGVAWPCHSRTVGPETSPW